VTVLGDKKKGNRKGKNAWDLDLSRKGKKKHMLGW
jgi:hypothetical protein